MNRDHESWSCHVREAQPGWFYVPFQLETCHDKFPNDVEKKMKKKRTTTKKQKQKTTLIGQKLLQNKAAYILHIYICGIQRFVADFHEHFVFLLWWLSNNWRWPSSYWQTSSVTQWCHLASWSWQMRCACMPLWKQTINSETLPAFSLKSRWLNQGIYISSIIVCNSHVTTHYYAARLLRTLTSQWLKENKWGKNNAELSTIEMVIMWKQWRPVQSQ